MDDSIERDLERANDVRRGADLDPNEAFRIAKRLARAQRLEAARRLAQHIRDDRRLEPYTAVELRQKLALWTSQNPDAPDDLKHDDALAILDSIQEIGGPSLAATTDPETLGIAGGICKRRWRVDGRRSTLEQSLGYYRRGTEQGIERDKGYTAINAAYVEDVLARLEDPEVQLPTTEAGALRQQVLETLRPLEAEPAYEGGPPLAEERWFHETIAEAHFGLREYAAAAERLHRIDWDEVAPWEIETTARQFAQLARLHDPGARSARDFERSEAWKVLRDCFGDDPTRGAGSLFAGKLGLALSGGGFRASFYHIGVLAALAELDMLRHVEVLSCVSGGSILGAHYYLEVRHLLQTNEDARIRREDYIGIVERLVERFLEGVEENIRTRVAGSVVGNLRMMFQPGYTRTNRLGELYEKHLYSRVADADDRGHRERRLRKLRIRPLGDERCNPKYDNWKRSNKLPILVLNATTVNTGHNWQFTASWMGEPPSQIESQVDGNYRLRRMYYDEAPEKHRDVTIGQAAAASSCVPGLFTPIEFQGLYEGITVRLVDGGVHDNQGVFGLLDQNCTVFVVSDASGQMSAIDQPDDGTLGVLLRSNSICMARVRTAEYRELDARRRSGRLKGLLFLHLKEGLDVLDRDWLNCDNPKQLSTSDLKARGQSLTPYQIQKSAQEQIAAIRTDLDSFSEAEAFALMTSGYRMARARFATEIEGFPMSEEAHPWRFLDAEGALRRSSDPEASRFETLLAVASQRTFKIWRLATPLKVLAGALALAVLAALCAAVYFWGDEPFLSGPGLTAAAAAAALGFAATSLGLGLVVRAIQYRKTVHQIAFGAGLSVFGAIAARIHLSLFDPWFLAVGRVRKKREDPEAGAR
ncbi:MAG: patatin-like phospholipase family protein [Myxococcota bacterium]|nr:patatin-like phospholipase family protein [Myxococcota bacterium]